MFILINGIVCVEIRFVSFNFGQIQKIRFVVVIVWSYSFGHLDLVK